MPLGEIQEHWCVAARGHDTGGLRIGGERMLLQLRRLVMAEADRFPELGRALYHGGPGRAIAGLESTYSDGRIATCCRSATRWSPLPSSTGW